MQNVMPPSLNSGQNAFWLLLTVFAVTAPILYIGTGYALWHDFAFWPLPIDSSWLDVIKYKMISILPLNINAAHVYPNAINYVRVTLGQTAVDEIVWRLRLTWLGVIIGDGLIFWLLIYSNPRMFAGKDAGDTSGSIIHIRGRKLYKGKAAHTEFAMQATKESRNDPGLCLYSTFPSISADRETRHFVIMGAVGGGKTQIFIPLIAAAQARGDRCLILDNKGDYTSGFVGQIVAPWDARSLVWDIAADCSTKSQARELAARLVQESKDPLWSNAARQVLTGIILKFQNERPGAWGFGDLAAAISLPQPELLAIMKNFFPEGIRAVEEASKTTQSILINLSAYMSIVFDLADAWSTPDPKKLFSFRRWLTQEGKEKSVKTVILQGNGQFSELQKSYVGGILGMMSQVINSPQIGESKTRRIWFFLDEFPQFSKIEGFSALLEIGRSKGIRVVIGLQDINQIRDLYGREQAESWMSMVGTQIFARISPGETADMVSALVGDREIERKNVSRSAGAGGTPNITISWQRETLPVIMPSQLNNELGKSPDNTGIRALLLGYKDALILTWPFSSRPKLREASVLADWTGWPASQKSVVTLSAPDAQIQTQEREQRPAPAIITQTHTAIPAAAVQAAELEPEEDAGDEFEGDLLKESGEEAAHAAADAILPGAGMVMKVLEVADDSGFFDGQSAPIPTTQAQTTSGKKRLKKRVQHEIDADTEEENE